MNEKEKEAIEFIKDLISWDVGFSQYPDKEDCEKLETILNLIEKQQKENEKLKNQEATARKINELLVQRYSNSISLQKVKDKIRHYQELQDNYIKKYDEINEGLQAMINVLQELLEGRK